MLVPEISLTAQTVGRFRSRFGETVAVFHSRLSAGERLDQWDMVASGAARVVVGARSALFCPLSDLGLIIIDEEHETSYKQGSSPRYHAREVAAEMARRYRCPLVLGSATPSAEAAVARITVPPGRASRCPSARDTPCCRQSALPTCAASSRTAAALCSQNP